MRIGEVLESGDLLVLVLVKTVVKVGEARESEVLLERQCILGRSASISS